MKTLSDLKILEKVYFIKEDSLCDGEIISLMLIDNRSMVDSRMMVSISISTDKNLIFNYFINENNDLELNSGYRLFKDESEAIDYLILILKEDRDNHIKRLEELEKRIRSLERNRQKK